MTKLDHDSMNTHRGESAHPDVCHRQRLEITKDGARQKPAEKTSAAPTKTTTPQRPRTIPMPSRNKRHQCILYTKPLRRNARNMSSRQRVKLKLTKTTTTTTATMTSECWGRAELGAA